MEEEAKTEKVKKATMKEMEQKKEQCSETLYALEEELKKTIAAQKSFKTEQAQVIKHAQANSLPYISFISIFFMFLKFSCNTFLTFNHYRATACQEDFCYGSPGQSLSILT